MNARYFPLCLLVLCVLSALLQLYSSDAVALRKNGLSRQHISPAVRKRRRPKLPKFGSGGEEEQSEQGGGEEDEEDDGVDEAVQDGVEDAVQDKAEETTNDALSCFPASATVTVHGGNEVLMSRLEIGDRVRVSVDGTLSDVFMFTHKRSSGLYPFLKISTEGGHSITLSPSHYIYASSLLKPAGNVVVGDTLEVVVAGGPARMSDTVTSIKHVVEEGLYNPQTLQGDIIVNGVRASTYTSAVHPVVAHRVALAPFRLLWSLTGLDFSAGLLHNGKLGSAYSWLLPRTTQEFKSDVL